MDGWGKSDAGAIISPSFAYGFSTSITGNVYHLEGQKLLYPAGQFFAVMGAEDGKASFIATNSSVRAVRGLRLSGNKKYLAVVEQTYDDDQQQVSVFNVPAEKHLRTLTLDRQHTHATTVVALSFSGDAKLLLVAAGEPDWTVMLWRWHNSKVALVINPEVQVVAAALNHWDDGFLALAGPHLARSYRLDMAAGTAKPNNHLMLDQHGSVTITCIIYLVGGLLAIGTNSGKIMVYNEAGSVASLEISTTSNNAASSMQHQDSGIPQTPASPSRTPTSRGKQLAAATEQQSAACADSMNGVQALVQRGRGFVAAGSNWDVYLFDPPAATTKRISGPEVFTMSRCFSFASAVGINSLPTSSMPSSGARTISSEAQVLGLSVSITDDHLALTTAAGKLLLLDMTAATAALEEAAEAAAASSIAAAAEAGGRSSSNGVQGAGAAAAVSCSNGSALTAPVAGAGADAEIDPADPHPAGWQVLCAGFPSARVVGLDASQHLPLLLVVSEDRWVRVWDWVRRTRVAARHLADEQPLCCALHPSGFMAAIGSTEGLRIYYILRRELAPMADLPVAKCCVARYSHGGAMLAAVGRSNAIVVYPAYYGGGSGASGTNPTAGHGSSSHYTQHSSAGGRGGPGSSAAAAAVAGVGSDGACILRPLCVLKAHVSTVTDLAFSGDDRRLVSSGAGGAVYFWDLSTGSRIMELEYVDKKCVYFAACYNDRHAAAVVRTMDGRLQHLQDGHLVYEVSGLGNDASPMAVAGDGRVVLTCTSRGSIISVPWPKNPEAAGKQLGMGPGVRLNDDADGLGWLAGSRGVSMTGMMQQQGATGTLHLQLGGAAAGSSPADGSEVYPSVGHSAFAKHLTVQVGAGMLASPRGAAAGSAATPGTCSGLSAAAARTPGSGMAVGTPCASRTPHGTAAAKTPGSTRPVAGGGFGSPKAGSKGCQNAGSGSIQEQQQHLQHELEFSELPASPGGWTATPASPGPAAADAGTAAAAAARAAGARAAGANAFSAYALGGGLKEYRLHSGRITAIKVLHAAGVVFTASTDGLVMMSSLSVVLDGILTEPPPLALPPSAAALGSTAAATAALALGPSHSLAASGLAAGVGALVPAGGVPGLPLPVVLVDEGLLLVMHERLRSMAAQVLAVQKEAQYQVLRKTQALKESLGMSDSQAAALAREVAQLRTALAESQAAADEAQLQVTKELESLHVAAAEQLEGLYEARLALQNERLAQLAAAKDDLEFSLKEEMKRQSQAAERHLAEVHNKYRQQIAAEAARAESAAAAAAESAAVWHEVLLQTEEDLEQQAERDGDRLAAARHEAGEAEMKLKAEINILLRSNNRLKADKAADAARVGALAAQVAALQQQLTEAGAVADKLRGELAERDGVIGDNYATLQGLRRRVQELETHKFVLGYKAEAAASELQPKEEQLAAMQGTLDAQDRELMAGRSALLAAQRAVGEKNAAVAAAKQELWEAKQALTRQAGLLEAVAQDIFHVLQQPDERRSGGKTARQQALEALATKYCTNRGGGPRSSVQVEAEMLAHIAAAEKKSKLLEEQLNIALSLKKRTGRRLMADNTALLADVAELQHSNRDLARQLAAATNQLAKFGVRLTGTLTAVAASRPASPRSGQDEAVAEHSGLVKGSGSRDRPTSAATGTASGGFGTYITAGIASRPTSPGRGGGTSAGRLLPASAGRVLTAAIEEQQQQLSELQSLLAATASVVASQAAHIDRLQGRVASIGEEQHGQEEPASSTDGEHHATIEAIKLVESARGGRSRSISPAEFVQGLPLAYALADDSSVHVAGGSSSGFTVSSNRWPVSKHGCQQHAGSGWRPDSAVSKMSAATAAKAGGLSPVLLSGISSLHSCSTARASGISSPGRPKSPYRFTGNSTSRPGSACSPSRGSPGSNARARPATASPMIRRGNDRLDAIDPECTGGTGGQQQRLSVTVGGSGHLASSGKVGLLNAVNASGKHSPPANVPKRRPTTAGGVGMLTCLKSDIEAWRAK